MRRTTFILCGLLLGGGLLWLFPLFHVVRIGAVHPTEREPTFNATDFSQTFWAEQLIPSLNEAADAHTVLKNLRDDPYTEREQFGRKVGVSRTRLVVLRGSGRIVSLEPAGVGVALEHGIDKPEIVLLTGLLFGNVVRDATGLLDAGDYSNSQHFNEISTELNRIVESTVIPTLKDKAKMGQQIQFAGCAEIPDDPNLEAALRVIPLVVSVQ